MPFIDVSNNSRFPGAETVLKLPLPVPFASSKCFSSSGMVVGWSWIFFDPFADFINDGVQAGDTVYLMDPAGCPVSEFDVVAIDSGIQLVTDYYNPLDFPDISYKIGAGVPLDLHSFAAVVEADGVVPYSVHHAALWLDAPRSLFYGDERGNEYYIGGD